MSVSVIVPNYNHAPYLRARIESILAQTIGDYELLILDDASTDGSRDIIAAFARDPRMRVAFNDRNGGNTFAQWRKGLEMTSGDYIWIAESDDAADPGLLSALSNALDRHPGAAMAVCESDVIDSRGAVVRPLETGYHATEERAFDGRAYARDHMYPWNSVPNASAVLFRRTAFDIPGVPATEMRLCGDWMSYCRILMRHGIVRVPQRLNYFREHIASVRRRSRAPLFLREAMAVQAYLREQLGVGENMDRDEIDAFFAQALLSPERRLPNAKVPLSRVAALLADAAPFGPKMLARVSKILLREGAAALVKKR